MKYGCDWCSAEFERKSNRGRKPRYCSPAHRQEAYQARRRSQAAAASADVGKEALTHGAFDDFDRATAAFEGVVAAIPSKQMAELAGAIDLRGIPGMQEILADAAFAKIDAAALSGMQDVLRTIDTSALTSLQQIIADSAFSKIDTSALSGITGMQDALTAIDTSALTSLQQVVADSAFSKIDTTALSSIQEAFSKIDTTALSGITGMQDAFAAIDTSAFSGIAGMQGVFATIDTTVLTSLQLTLADAIDTSTLTRLQEALTAIDTSGIANMQNALSEQLSSITGQLDLMEPLRRLTTDLLSGWTTARPLEPLLSALIDQADFGEALSGIDWSAEFSDTFGHLDMSGLYEWLDGASHPPRDEERDSNDLVAPAVVMLIVAVAVTVAIGPALTTLAEGLAVEVLESIYFTLLLANEVGTRTPALGGTGYLITMGTVAWWAWKIARAALGQPRSKPRADGDDDPAPAP